MSNSSVSTLKNVSLNTIAKFNTGTIYGKLNTYKVTSAVYPGYYDNSNIDYDNLARKELVEYLVNNIAHNPNLFNIVRMKSTDSHGEKIDYIGTISILETEDVESKACFVKKDMVSDIYGVELDSEFFNMKDVEIALRNYHPERFL